MPDYSDFMPVEEKGPFLPGTAFSFNYMAWLKGNAGKRGGECGLMAGYGRNGSWLFRIRPVKEFPARGADRSDSTGFI